jgi:hypothetical protein
MSGGNAQRETLESWKQIAAYLNRSERTVRRWESSEGLPVHRHGHQKQDTVFAHVDEINRWVGRPTAVKAYWDAVGEAVRAVARSISVEQLSMPVDVARLHRMKDDGTLGNERAMWLPSFLEGKNKAWFLSMAVWHTAEHLLGGVVCVRRVSGVPLGI